MKVVAPFTLLTRLIRRTATLEEIGETAFLFPLVGGAIGLVVGTVAWSLGAFLPYSVAAALALVTLYGVTGLLHLDGLADFADGLAMSGDAASRREAMRHPGIGAGGVLATFLVLLATWAALAELLSFRGKSSPGWMGVSWTIGAFIVSETGAKLAMNFAMLVGRPLGDGMAATVMAHTRHRHFLAAVAIALSISLLFTGPIFAPAVFLPWLPTALLVSLAHRRIGGLSGDVLGTVNEVARATLFVVWVVFLRIP